MPTSFAQFTSDQYGPRAEDYIASPDHSSGPDLDQIEEELRDGGAWRVLDLGCGGGHVSYRAAPHVREVVACDVTKAMIDAVAREAGARGLSNVVVRRAAAESLPFADAEFDAVLCRLTAHHWQDLEAGLREAARVLKPRGRAVFVDVVSPNERVLDTHLQTVELLRDISHVRNYSMGEWFGALVRCGFSVEAAVTRKMPMNFPVWIARTRAPKEHEHAIRSLQSGAPDVVKEYFNLRPDGGFDIDAATFIARRASASAGLP